MDCWHYWTLYLYGEFRFPTCNFSQVRRCRKCGIFQKENFCLRDNLYYLESLPTIKSMGWSNYNPNGYFWLKDSFLSKEELPLLETKFTFLDRFKTKNEFRSPENMEEKLKEKYYQCLGK